MFGAYVAIGVPELLALAATTWAVASEVVERRKARAAARIAARFQRANKPSHDGTTTA
jgi:hypothetical protein